MLPVSEERAQPPGSDPGLNNPSHFSTVPLGIGIQGTHTCPAVATAGLSALGLKKDADFLEYLPCNFYRNKLHSIKNNKPGNFLVETCFLELAVLMGAFQDVSSCPRQVTASTTLFLG